MFRDGRLPHPDTVRKRFDRLVAAAGQLRIPFHDLRHSYVAGALEAGVSPKVVGDKIEHSNVGLFPQNGAHVLNHGDRGPPSKQRHSCSGRSGITVPAIVWRYVCLQICPQMSRNRAVELSSPMSIFVGLVIPLDCTSPTDHTLIYDPASGVLSWSRPGAETKLAFR